MLQLSHAEFQKMMIGHPVKETIETGHDLYHTNYESTIKNEWCEGSSKSTIIREGITFLQVEIKFFQDTVVEMMSTNPQVGFAFCLKGNSIAHLEKINDLNVSTSLEYTDKIACIYANKSSYGHQEFKANQSLHSYYIHFNYGSFLDIMGNAKEYLPELLYKTLTSMEGSYMHFHPMSLGQIAICFQLQHNSFVGKSREFFIESKVFELIAHQIDILINAYPEQQVKSRSLSKWEEECIDQCYQLMENNLKNPPSLIKLAKETGLSIYRLKKGLFLRYGNTPFKLLTEMRMLKAKEMLLRGEANISEVASEVGYSSIGSFSNTFFERFGVKPGSYTNLRN